MKWLVKYEGQGASGIAVLYPHNTNAHRWYNDINKAYAHLEAHRRMQDGYKFWIEECAHENKCRKYPNGYTDMRSSYMECMECEEMVGK